MCRRALVRALLICLTMVWLLDSICSCGATEKSGVRVQITSNDVVYVAPQQDGRDMAEMNDVYYDTIQVQKRHIKTQNEKIAALSADVSELQAAVDAERAGWQKSLAAFEKNTTAMQKKIKKLQSPWAAGLFAGWDAIHQEVVVGLGIVYSLVRF